MKKNEISVILICLDKIKIAHHSINIFSISIIWWWRETWSEWINSSRLSMWMSMLNFA